MESNDQSKKEQTQILKKLEFKKNLTTLVLNALENGYSKETLKKALTKTYEIIEQKYFRDKIL